MVMLEPVPLSRGFGEQAGRFLHDRLAEHGITVCGDDELDRFEGADGRVTRVITKRGRELEADAVVIGVGAAPDVMLARSAGLELGETGGVRVDSRLQTRVPGIFAAGDVAEYESVVHGGRSLRIEHWDVAFSQGRTAALNMLGRDQPHDVVPYFFSDLSDWASLEYVGPAFDWDEEVIRGSIDDGEFSVWYLKDGRVAGALSIGRSEDLSMPPGCSRRGPRWGISPGSSAISRPTSARSRARCPEVRPRRRRDHGDSSRGRGRTSGSSGRPGRWAPPGSRSTRRPNRSIAPSSGVAISSARSNAGSTVISSLPVSTTLFALSTISPPRLSIRCPTSRISVPIWTSSSARMSSRSPSIMIASARSSSRSAISSMARPIAVISSPSSSRRSNCAGA